jgi:NAD(P)-dependent dehydrogenase (short-subunit alcohol dehydrogenase family)
VVGLIKTAALEFAQKNIRVNCVCPGFIRTAMTERAMDKALVLESEMIAIEPIGRLGKPEIAAGVLWLLSDAASFVTGHSLTIDGGWTAR